MEAIESDCKFPSDFFEAIKFDLVHYNPFCANNRDPGATGNDQCRGVRDIKNPFNRKDVSAAAGIKINASLALLLPLVSFLFAPKVFNRIKKILSGHFQIFITMLSCINI